MANGTRGNAKRMQNFLKTFKKFDGVVFGKHTVHDKKTAAKKAAERVRNKGNRARVVNARGVWVVYARAGRR